MTSRNVRHLLITTDTVGGVWQYSIELAAGLAAHDYRTTLVTLGPAPTLEQKSLARSHPSLRLIETELPLDWLSDSPETIEDAARQLAKMAEELRVDCVHLNSPALAGSASWPAPTITVAHGCVATWWHAVRHRPLDAEFSWHRDLVRRGLLAANAVVAPSRSFARDLRQVYDLPFTPMVVNNGRRSANTETRHIPVQEALAVGRLWDEAKNATVLDHAAALARTPLSAIGAARGPQGQEFRAEHLRHIGHLSDDELAQMLARRPIFVSTAIFEPFGLAILEAAAAGCALVLSDIPTFRELWNGAAVFVSANDAQGFADAVDLLATDQPRRTDLGKRAATRAARYTPESCVALTAAIYDNLLAQEEVAA